MYTIHYLYKTTNTVNNKIYIGVHSTNNIDDGYQGSGKVLKYSIAKYGKDKFITDILYYFNSREDAENMEAQIVNEEFIKRLDTYNLVLGGKSGMTANQFGSNNIMFGKIPLNAKQVKATHKDGRIETAPSMSQLGVKINIARQNIRKLISSGKQGKKGWKVELV